MADKEQTTHKLPLIQLNSADRDSYIGLPNVNESVNTSHPYIAYGNDNLYPNYLRSLTHAPIHSALLQTKSSIIYGGGLETKDNPIAIKRWQKLARYDDANECDLNSLFYSICRDIAVYGAYSVLYKMGAPFRSPLTGLIEREITAIKYVPFESVRYGRPYRYEDEFGPVAEPLFAYLSRDWSAGSMSRYADYYHPSERRGNVMPSGINTPYKVPLWHQSERIPENYDLYLFIGQGDKNGNNWYPIAPYHGIINDIVALIELQKHRANHTAKSFNATTVFAMPTPLDGDPEQLEQLQKMMQMQYTGAKNAGGVMFLFPTSQVLGGTPVVPTVNQLQQVDYGHFDATMFSTAQSIATGHGVPAILQGMTTGSFIAINEDMIKASLSLFREFYALKNQQLALQFLDEIAKWNSWFMPVPTVVPSLTYQFIEDMKNAYQSLINPNGNNNSSSPDFGGGVQSAG